MTAQPSGNAGPAVAALIRAANIELIPLRGAQEQLNVVPAGTKITITCSPKFGLEERSNTPNSRSRQAMKSSRISPPGRSRTRGSCATSSAASMTSESLISM